LRPSSPAATFAAGGRGHAGDDCRHGMARRYPAVICIVDDDEALLLALARLLAGAGYAVATFSSAQSLLRFERLAEAHCLLVDVNLLDGDGIALQERLLATGMRLPVVFMSGSPDATTRERALRAGAVDYVKKPFDAVAVLAALRKAFGGG